MIQISNSNNQNQNIEKTTLVVCRYNENIEWIKNIKNHIEIIVYNKGELNIDYLDNCNNITIINIPNISREEFVYIKYILDNYYNLSNTVIFSQGSPFLHSPNFIDLLNNRTSEFSHVQPLTIGYSIKNPPQIFRNISSKYMNIGHIEFFNNNFDKLIRNKLIRKSGGHQAVYSKLSKFLSTNMVRNKMMEYIEIKPRNFNNMEISPLCYAAIFSVSKDRIEQYNIDVYKKLINLSISLSEKMKENVFAYLMEFSWMEFFRYEPPEELFPI